MKNKFVYYGSAKKHTKSSPKKHIRRDKDGNIIFQDISFHATPYKWIALAYTYQEVKNEEKYNMSVDLYKNSKEVFIWGREALEGSLDKLYKNGGFLHTFDAKDFHHKKGLGTAEVVTEKEIKPIKIERVEDPVSEMKKLGVKFIFAS